MHRFTYDRVYRDGHGRTLYVEDRELYTRYRLYLRYGSIWHDVRNCYPLPPYAPQIIYARTIPWFMWVIYWLRGLPREFSQWREFRKQGKALAEKQKQIRAYQKRVLERQFIQKGSRYNR